jgi:hypothetical protein
VIAWWGWLLIWFGLALMLLGVLAYCAWRLFQKFMGVQRGLFDLIEKAAILDGVTAEAQKRPINAVLEESAVVREAFHARMQRRRHRKTARQRARLERAKLISSVDVTSVDITSRKFPHEHG